MGYIIFTVLMLILAIGLLLGGRSAAKYSRRTNLRSSASADAMAAAIGLRVIAAVVVVIFLAVTAANSYATINPQSAGVELSLGRTAGFLTNGTHYKNPWETVTPIDETVQTSTWAGSSCLTVRIADSQTACVDASVQWKINYNAADYLFRSYNKGDLLTNITNALVLRRLEVSLSNAFGEYNPINSATSANTLGTPTNPTVTQLAAKVYTQLKADVGKWIVVRDVLIPRISYNSAVEAALSNVLRQVAQTQVAKEAVLTALAQAQANKDLQANLNMLVLIQNCENLVGEAEKINYALPVGFNCLGSSSVGIVAGK